LFSALPLVAIGPPRRRSLFILVFRSVFPADPPLLPASADPSHRVLPSFLHRSGGTLRCSPGLRPAPVSPLAEVVRDMGAPRGFGGMAERAALPLGRGGALCTGPRAVGVVVGQWIAGGWDAGIGIP
jgi:hypothetical protein